LDVTFHGVRGSTPCSCESNRRYGGNTACVAIELPDTEPIILDLGTGLRFFGETQPLDGTFRGHALVTHLHWDHVQGLPFCAPINREGAQLDVYGPPQEGLTLAEAFEEFMRPPYFPVRIGDLMGDIRFHTVDDTDFAVGDMKVRARYVPHVGTTFGYRVEHGGMSIAYISDHQQPLDGMSVAPEVLELVDGVDLLIHDAQFTDAEFAVKAHWGHCTIDYALHVAREAGARRIALFHHDPAHSDDEIDRLLEGARSRTSSMGPVEVMAAYEGLTVSLDGVSSLGAVPAAAGG
jgi:phosphoribosyl 1,2-cyclic phosphodiesterase